MKATLPNGTSVSKMVARLEKLEETARMQRLGAYGSDDAIRRSTASTDVPDEPIAPVRNEPVSKNENLTAQINIRADLDRLNSIFAKSKAKTSSKSKSPTPAPSGAISKPQESPSDLTFLNTASNEELREIPGVGPKLATAIIENRPFKKFEDLKSVPGIGQQKYQAAVLHLNP